MLSRSTLRPGGRIAAVAVVLMAAACSGSDSTTDSTAASTTLATVDSTLPEFTSSDDVVVAGCATRRASDVPDWPFDIVDLFTPIAATVEGTTYRAEGVTNNAEAVLIAALEETFVDLDASEPSGGATDITVEFTDANSSITLTMEDPDEDDCWDVVVVAEYVEQPPVETQTVVTVSVADVDAEPVTTLANGDPADGEPEGPDVVDPVDDPPTSSDFDATGIDDGVGDTVAPVDPLDQLGDQGRAEVIAARGTFNVGITECSVDPVAVQGISSDGTLVATGTAPDAVTVTWTYPDGVVVTDSSARVVALTAAGGTLIADGTNPDGPETIIINLACVTAS